MATRRASSTLFCSHFLKSQCKRIPQVRFCRKHPSYKMCSILACTNTQLSTEVAKICVHLSFVCNYLLKLENFVFIYHLCLFSWEVTHCFECTYPSMEGFDQYWQIWGVYYLTSSSPGFKLSFGYTDLRFRNLLKVDLDSNFEIVSLLKVKLKPE